MELSRSHPVQCPECGSVSPLADLRYIKNVMASKPSPYTKKPHPDTDFWLGQCPRCEADIYQSDATSEVVAAVRTARGW